MSFDFTKLMDAASKNKLEKRMAKYEERTALATKAKSFNMAKPPPNGRVPEKLSSKISKSAEKLSRATISDPSKKSNGQVSNKTTNGHDVRNTNGFAAKTSSKTLSDSKFTSTAQVSRTAQSTSSSKSTSKIDPARVAEYLKKKQSQEQDEERRRLEEKRRVMEYRTMKEREQAAITSAKRRKLEIADSLIKERYLNEKRALAERRRQPSVEKQPKSDVSNKEKDAEKCRSDSSFGIKRTAMADTKTNSSGLTKSHSHANDEPVVKKRKLNSSDRETRNVKRPTASGPSSVDFNKLMQIAVRNQHTASGDEERVEKKGVDNKRQQLKSVDVGHKSLPSIPIKRDSQKSSSSSTIDRRHNDHSLQRKVVGGSNSSTSSSLNKSNSVQRQGQHSASTSSHHKSNSVPKHSLPPIRSGSSSQNLPSSSKVLRSPKSDPSVNARSKPNLTKASSSLSSSTGNSKNVNGPQKPVTATVSSKKPTQSSNNAKPASGSVKSHDTNSKKSPLMMKSVALASSKSAMLSAKPISAATLATGKTAKLISAPIFDAPRVERQPPAQKNIAPAPAVKKPNPGPTASDIASMKKPLPHRPPQPQVVTSSSKKGSSMSQAELFNRKLKLKKEEERARLLALKKLSKNPNWEEDDDDEDDEEEEYDSEMDDFIDDGPLDGEDDDDYSEHIKSIFGYDRNKYRFMDDDDDPDMESDYRRIQKEEAVSARAGLKEDLEELVREQQMEARMKKRRMR